MVRFRQAHDLRISEWFKQLGDRLLAEYRDRKRRMELSALPAEETVLADQHSAVLHEINDRINEVAERLADTQQYVDTRERLDAVASAEWDRLRRKNIELWKVHSDEATQCALEMNREFIQRECGQGWMCLYRLWPSSHYKQSKRHLDQCFERVSVKMPASMRDAVFESWYEKELAGEASEVKKNLFIMLCTVSIPLAWLGFLKMSSKNNKKY